MTPKERTFMKMILATLILVAVIGGCAENDRSRRIDILQTQVDGLQRQVDSLKDASIQNSKSINNLSDGMTSAAESIDNLANATKANTESIRIVAHR